MRPAGVELYLEREVIDMAHGAQLAGRIAVVALAAMAPLALVSGIALAEPPQPADPPAAVATVPQAQEIHECIVENPFDGIPFVEECGPHFFRGFDGRFYHERFRELHDRHFRR